MAAIDRPYPSGGTPLGEYTKVAADRLLRARDEQHGYGTYRLLVVTDGEATDARKLEKFVPDVVGRGITLDTIGVSMSGDHTLKRMATSYRSADDPESLTKAVQAVLAEVSAAGTDSAGNDAFADIDGLPHEFAMTLLESLSTSGNHPIGTKRRPKSAGTPASSGQDPNVPMNNPTPSDCSTTPANSWLWMFALLPLLGRRREK
jgi:hypothetical protein